jgi:cell division transport system permease protein
MSNPYDLPLNKDITARFVPKIIALMVYLGTLCFVFTLFMLHSSSLWEKKFTTHLSIEIPTINETSSTSLQGKVLELLNGTPEIQQAKAVPQKDMVDLFRSLLGDDTPVDLLSLPVVIDVSLKNKENIDIKKLEISLKRISPYIHLTDHRLWQMQVANLIHAVLFITFFLTAIILCAALATATFATKTSLLIHRHVIEVLSLIGATHSYIAKQFQIHILKQAGLASLIGSTSAFLTFFVILTLLEQAELPFMVKSSFFSQALFVFALAPFLTAFIMMFSVRIAVMKALRS